LVTKSEGAVAQCIPNAVFEASYAARLADVISIEEPTCVIAPFKSSADDAFKHISKMAVKYSQDWRDSDPRVCVGTTAILYTPAVFDHYIFYEFPPSLDHLKMACACGRKVTVLVNVSTAGKLQALSHSRGIDQSLVSKLMQSLFWNGTEYRKVGEITALSSSGFDLSPEAFEEFVTELVRERFLDLLPFRAQNVAIRIRSMASDVVGSRLIDAVVQRAVNAKGQYNIPVLELCNALQISPLELDHELEGYRSHESIDFAYSEEVDFFIVKRTVTDDDEFAEAVTQMTQTMARLEAEADHSFDVLFTVVKNNEEINSVWDRGEPELLIPIPRAEINTTQIKKLLSTHTREEWTPRAVARVFHAISSPKFDSREWMRTPFWGTQTMASFRDIMVFCQQVMCNPFRISDS
jgi:hypothetical protein